MSENDKLDTVSSNDIKPQEAPRRRRRPVEYQVADDNLNPQEEVIQVSAQYTRALHTEPFEDNQNSRIQEFDAQIHQEHTKIEYNTKKNKKKKENLKRTPSLVGMEKRKKRRRRIKIILGIVFLILIILNIIPIVVDKIQSAKWAEAESAAMEKNYERGLYTDLTSSGLVIGSEIGKDGSKSVKCISSPSVDGVITLNLPDIPFTISNNDQTLSITNFKIESKNNFSDELLFSGEISHNQHGTTPMPLKWTIYDRNGNDVFGGRIGTLPLAVGEKFQDHSGIVYDLQIMFVVLRPGEYTFQLSSEDISVAESVPPVTNTPIANTERPSSSLSSIQYTLYNNSGSVEIDLPDIPLVLSDDYRTLTITDFKSNSKNESSYLLLCSGEVNYSKLGTKSHMLNYRILDCEGYVISSGFGMTPPVAEGERFRDCPCAEFYYDEFWGDLGPGKYTLQLYL